MKHSMHFLCAFCMKRYLKRISNKTCGHKTCLADRRAALKKIKQILRKAG